MSTVCVRGGRSLYGSLCASGSKNSSLPLIAASLMCKEESVLCGVPDILDVKYMCDLIASFGADVNIEKKKSTTDSCMKISVKSSDQLVLPTSGEAASKIRASILVAGAVLSRFGYVEVYLPGGCAIGARPIAMHLKAFQLMGAEVEYSKNLIKIFTNKKRLKGAIIDLQYPSVGVTENLLMASALADGFTKILCASVEPEVLQLVNALNSAGAKIQRFNYDTFYIEGVDSLSCFYEDVISDRIELFTYAALVGACGGKIEVKNSMVDSGDKIIIDKLIAIGIDLEIKDKEIIFSRELCNIPLRPASIVSAPYPGFPSDLQPQFAALLAFADGISIIEENVYSQRFQYAEELSKMGFNKVVSNNKLFIHGKKNSFVDSSKIRATDLRAAAALLIAALGAKAETKIECFSLINRGYSDIIDKLQLLGGDIEKLD